MSLLDQQIDPPHGSLDAGSIAVVDHQYVSREPSDEPDLFRSQRRTAGSHYISDSVLVQHDRIHISFGEDTSIFIPDMLLGLVQAVENLALW